MVLPASSRFETVHMRMPLLAAARCYRYCRCYSFVSIECFACGYVTLQLGH